MDSTATLDSNKDARWVVRAQDEAAAQALAEALDLPVGIAHLLVCRGLATPEAARAHLNPALDQLYDPYLMLGMTKAVERIRASLSAREPVLIYGDYDVDGTVATVLLKTAMERVAVMLGVAVEDAAALVRYHIPHRIREGYGITESRLEDAADEGVRLVVSVDTGIRAFAAAREAERLGLDLIVTDHHLPDGAEGVPQAVAVLNPNQAGCGYPCKGLCGAAVAFKLAQALLESAAANAGERDRLREKTLPSFLKLLAIATIADAVPLTGENRVIAALGLRELQRPSQPGLRALMELAQIDTAIPISATDVGFRLAPRINAAGRMDIASDVVEMFLSRDPAAARVLAEKLHRLNDERRAVEAEALRDIETRIETMREEAEGLAACLVLDDAKWHRGVIGILASRVVDRTGRPALVLAHENGHAYGSGRSIAGFHLLDALTAVDSSGPEKLLTRFGGHAHAVGFSLPSDRVAELRTRMTNEAQRVLSGQRAVVEMECDAELRLTDLTPAFLEWLERLGPYGNGNSEPLFMSHGVRLAAAFKVVKDKHLRVAVQDGDARFGGMAWSRRTNWAERAQTWGLTPGALVDLAYRLRKNRHPDFGGWELEIVAMRPAPVAASES
ncbi:MAG: single-stranded-DNA-specific exonuclease RecJ [Acidobacteriota bacterium]|nr:single-stranded-DNA-specific exonuclease RecJ [Acidobacteriota bacterium]